MSTLSVRVCVCVQSLDRYTPLHVACSYLPMVVTDRNRWLENQQKTKIRQLLGLDCDCTLPDKVTTTPFAIVCVCVVNMLYEIPIGWLDTTILEIVIAGF